MKNNNFETKKDCEYYKSESQKSGCKILIDLICKNKSKCSFYIKKKEIKEE